MWPHINCAAYVRHCLRHRNLKQVQMALLPPLLPAQEHLRDPHADRRSHYSLPLHLDLQQQRDHVQVQLRHHSMGLPRPCSGPIPTAHPLPVLQQPPQTHPLPLIRRG